MSKFDQFKLFCIIQLQKVDQREIHLRKEIAELSIQREYLAGFLSDIENVGIFDMEGRSPQEIEIFRSLMLRTKTK
jgi:hypothetical protein|tara:strand:+ start:3398 stop:3625 length:228 start_codon:yes stop_codon:yes gene_type:complete